MECELRMGRKVAGATVFIEVVVTANSKKRTGKPRNRGDLLGVGMFQHRPREGLWDSNEIYFKEKEMHCLYLPLQSIENFPQETMLRDTLKTFFL